MHLVFIFPHLSLEIRHRSRAERENPFYSIRLQALCALSNQGFPKWNQFSTLLRVKGAFWRCVTASRLCSSTNKSLDATYSVRAFGSGALATAASQCEVPQSQTQGKGAERVAPDGLDYSISPARATFPYFRC